MDFERISQIQNNALFYFESETKNIKNELALLEIKDASVRKLFDESLDITHYAKSCQRVGRCMRLAIIYKQRWAGGIVLGSTFPNIEVRDRFIGLKKHVQNVKERGLKHPWSKENKDYWGRLQKVVNHARTFVFPNFQGFGIATKAHKILLTEGVEIWEEKYNDKVGALDTLCDHGDSKLFLKNDWSLVGETKGYGSNPKAKFSKKSEDNTVKNNVGLALNENSTKWVVWVKIIDEKILT